MNEQEQELKQQIAEATKPGTHLLVDGQPGIVVTVNTIEGLRDGIVSEGLTEFEGIMLLLYYRSGAFHQKAGRSNLYIGPHSLRALQRIKLNE